MSRVFLVLFLGLILLACLLTMMYGFWLSANNHIVHVKVIFFLPLLTGIFLLPVVVGGDGNNVLEPLCGLSLLFIPIFSMLFFVLLLLSAIIYPFHMVEKGCDNLPKEEKTLDIAFNRALLRIYYNDIQFLIRYVWSPPKS